MNLFSFIIPVYNRPSELSELLLSITKFSGNDFEVIVVDDGSLIDSYDVCKKYSKQYSLQYFYQDNSGPGYARNKGAENAKGNWLIFLDSDTILPENYFINLKNEIQNNDFDCFGGPDRTHYSFNNIQKAIGYAMSGFLTTGGIRGGNEKIDKFYPRSYNLGVKKIVFDILDGFNNMRFGEDLDFCMRLIENGYVTILLKEVYVFHKRRNNFFSFYKQVYNSGVARINLGIRHPRTIKIVHWFPTFFVIGNIALIVLSFLFPFFIFGLSIMPIILFTDAYIKNKNIKVSFLSIVASFVQLFGYGLGFATAFWKRKILGNNEFHSFKRKFY